jgi:hypothetical protein
MTHKELTAHFRSRLKASSVKACCRMDVNCGDKTIIIDVPSYEATFSHDEQRTILDIAIANGLTLSRGFAIDPHQMTYSKTATFYLP